jgi:hypothetical protein
MLPTELMLHVAATCEEHGLSYFVTGSMASSFYGEMRATRDVDLVVELAPWHVEKFCAAFPQPEWYVSTEAATKAATAGEVFNILHNPTRLKADIICFADNTFNEGRLMRSRVVKVAGLAVRMAAPADVILSKLLFFKKGGSDKHVRDILGMFRVSGEDIDLQFLDHWSLRLAVRDEWKLVCERLGRTPEAR